jgi:hypothetical protein
VQRFRVIKIAAVIFLTAGLLISTLRFHIQLFSLFQALLHALKTAFAFWRSHETQVSSLKNLVLYAILFIVVVPLVIGFVVLLYKEISRSLPIVEPFGVPKEFGDMGLTSEVIASRVRDKLRYIGKVARMKVLEEEDSFVLPKEVELTLDVEIPGTKIGVKVIVELLRALFGKYPTRISGDIVLPMSSQLILENSDATVTVRISRNNRVGKFLLATASPKDPDPIVQNAAEVILRRMNPIQLGAYYSRTGNQVAAEGLLLSAINDPSQSEKHRAVASNALGTIFADRRMDDDAIQAYQQATRLNPSFAFPYNNLGACG